MNTKYKVEIKQQNNSQTIATSSRNINAIQFINKSATNTPTINGYPLAYNEVLSINGNENETDETIYNVEIPTTGTADLWIITKYNF